MISLRRFNIVLPSARFLREAVRSHFYESWPFHTHQDGRLQCHLRLDTALCMRGMDTVVTSEPSRLFTLGVVKLSCTCTGGTKCFMSRFAAEQTQHASRQYSSEDNWCWPCDKHAWKQTSPSPTLQWTLLRPSFGGGQEKRFKGYIKSSIRKYGIPFDRLEELARDREEWRAVCDKGLATFEQQHVDVAEAKRMCRHQQCNPPPPTTTRQGFACTVCGHVCASAYGLESHMRRHKETRWAASSSIRRTTNYYYGSNTSNTFQLRGGHFAAELCCTSLIVFSRKTSKYTLIHKPFIITQVVQINISKTLLSLWEDQIITSFDNKNFPKIP